MRIAVMGAGAVGAYFGAKLAAVGHHEVAFIARGAHLQAMKKKGLAIQSFAGDFTIHDALFTDNPAEAGPTDLVLFCVKSYDTEAVAKLLAPMMTPATIVLSLQNGIDNADKIARLWSRERVLAGVVYIGAALACPGVIEHLTGGRIIFGALEAQITDTTNRVAEILSQAQIPFEVSPVIHKIQWRKLLWNAAFCAISTLTRADTGEIVTSDSLSSLAVDCMNEVRAAAAVAGIDLEAASIEETMNFSRTLGNFKPSMLQDLEANKPLEYEAFNGIVVKQLSCAGKAAPINDVFYHALGFLDRRIREQKKG